MGYAPMHASRGLAKADVSVRSSLILRVHDFTSVLEPDIVVLLGCVVAFFEGQLHSSTGRFVCPQVWQLEWMALEQKCWERQGTRAVVQLVGRDCFFRRIDVVCPSVTP